MRMKVRKNLSLEAKAVKAGERAAKRSGLGSLSELVENTLLALDAEEEEHFSKHTGKPLPLNDARRRRLASRHA